MYFMTNMDRREKNLLTKGTDLIYTNPVGIKWIMFCMNNLERKYE